MNRQFHQLSLKQFVGEIAIFQVLVSPEVGERDTASHYI
jgi:hypothetical protein